MTEKQRRFCIEYAACGNSAEAARRAGYSQRTARTIGADNLTKADVQNYLAEIAEKVQSEKIANITEMQEKLTSIIRQELDEEVIVVEGCGDGVSEAATKTKKASLKDITKAIEVLARMQGVLETKTTVNVAVPVFSGEGDLLE